MRKDALDERGRDVARARASTRHGVAVDVTKYESVEQLADAAFAHYGGVHVLCNNAGVGSGAEGFIWEHELADWKWGFDVNVWGVIHGIKAFVPRDGRAAARRATS